MNEKKRINCSRARRPAHSNYIYSEEKKDNQIAIDIISLIVLVGVASFLLSLDSGGCDFCFLPILGIFGWFIIIVIKGAMRTANNLPDFYQLEVSNGALIESSRDFGSCSQRKTLLSDIKEIARVRTKVSGKYPSFYFDIRTKDEKSICILEKSFEPTFQQSEIKEIDDFLKKNSL